MEAMRSHHLFGWHSWICGSIRTSCRGTQNESVAEDVKESWYRFLLASMGKHLPRERFITVRQNLNQLCFAVDLLIATN